VGEFRLPLRCRRDMGSFLEFYAVQIGSEIQQESISQFEASQEELCSVELTISLNLDR
jgi:hypothetical protein